MSARSIIIIYFYLEQSRAIIFTLHDRIFLFPTFRDLRATEILTSTASAKRIINSIFILLQFFLTFFHSSTSFKFIFIFFFSLRSCRGKDEIFFPGFFYCYKNFKLFNWSEVVSAEATLKLRDVLYRNLCPNRAKCFKIFSFSLLNTFNE